jgi:hypothetical protein
MLPHRQEVASRSINRIKISVTDTLGNSHESVERAICIIQNELDFLFAAQAVVCKVRSKPVKEKQSLLVIRAALVPMLLLKPSSSMACMMLPRLQYVFGGNI